MTVPSCRRHEPYQPHGVFAFVAGRPFNSSSVRLSAKKMDANKVPCLIVMDIFRRVCVLRRSCLCEFASLFNCIEPDCSACIHHSEFCPILLFFSQEMVQAQQSSSNQLSKLANSTHEDKKVHDAVAHTHTHKLLSLSDVWACAWCDGECTSIR